MNKQYRIIFIVTIIALFLSGCKSPENEDSGPASSLPSSTSNVTLQWMEYEGRFYTKDLERAQK